MQPNLRSTLLPLLLAAFLFVPRTAWADSSVENVGVALGVVAGNMIYVPMKVSLAAFSIPQGLLSWLFSGDREQSEEVFRNSLEGPYFITPEIARFAMGYRPDEKENAGMDDGSGDASAPQSYGPR